MRVSGAAVLLLTIVGVGVGMAIGWFAHANWALMQAVAPPASDGTPIPLIVASPARGRTQLYPKSEAPPRYIVTSAPSPQASPVVLPPEAPPKIFSVTLSSQVVTAGDVVTGSVQTSSNVASVEARIAGYSQSLAKTGPGHFTLSYRVPNLPPFLRRTYAVEVIAHNTGGDVAAGTVPITIR